MAQGQDARTADLSMDPAALYLEENVAAATLRLSAEDLAALG